MTEKEAETFTIICDLIDQHGSDVIIQILATHAQFDSENMAFDRQYRRWSAHLQLELEQLLERMDDYIIPDSDEDKPDNVIDIEANEHEAENS